MRAIRTSWMPSRAISFTAASRMRARALARAAALDSSTPRTLLGSRHERTAARPRVRRRGPDPREVDAELRRLTDDDVATIRREALERRVSGGLHAVEHGGQGWTREEWFLVEEQFGRSTNALSWHVPSAYNVLASGTPEQIERYLKPALRGELH